MSEFSGSRDIILNGCVIPEGRTRLVEGNTDEYRALDLRDVEPGGILTIVTSNGAHQLIKTETEPGGSRREGWVRTTAEQTLGAAVRLTLLEPSSAGGTPFLTPGIVVKRGLEMGVTSVETEPGSPSVRESLGVIGIIAYHQHTSPSEAINSLRLEKKESVAVNSRV